jgi:branched-chain amino acid transport system substrate-binding protein
VKVRAPMLVGLLALALGLAACGGGSSSGSSGSGGSGGRTVDVYSSLPLQGASKDQTGDMVKGIELALGQAGGKAGNVKVQYTSLDDSTAETGTWDPQRVAANARRVVQDKNAVGYIGEFNSPASAISIPILNLAGLAEISPTNTYVGLTTNEPGSAKGEPDKYYPNGTRNYVRLTPRDSIQAAALVAAAQQAGCQKVALANDLEAYGVGLAKLVELKAKAAGLALTGDDGLDVTPNYRAYASKIKGEGADCFLFAGITAKGAVQLFKDVNAALPKASLFAGDGACESGLTNPSKGGFPANVGAKFHCTIATLDLPSYPGGRKFLADFKAKYGDSSPDPFAIFGYESMRLVLDTIAAGGTDRASFLKQLFATKDRNSVIGTYSVQSTGDSTLTDFGLYGVDANGDPKYKSTIKAGS